MHTSERYMPVLKYHWLTPLYDPLLSRFMHEDIFKKRLIEQAQLKPGMHLLDVGCGTGALAMMIKRAYPQVEVNGLDGDPQVINIARRKSTQAELDITLDLGMAYSLPYQENYFECVVSSMMMHHLSRERKTQALQEVHRVLRMGGEFHLVDFGPPSNIYTRLGSILMQRIEELEDNINGNMIKFIRLAGFTPVTETGQFDTFAGTLVFYKAIK